MVPRYCESVIVRPPGPSTSPSRRCASLETAGRVKSGAVSPTSIMAHLARPALIEGILRALRSRSIGSSRQVSAPYGEEAPEKPGHEAEREEKQARRHRQEAHGEDAEKSVLRRRNPREDRAGDDPQERERDEGAE